MNLYKLHFYPIFILIIISFMACQPMNKEISANEATIKSTPNLKNDSTNHQIYQRFLDNYEFNRKMKLKIVKIYDISDEDKTLSQIIQYDTDGKIQYEKRYQFFKYDTLTTLITYEYNKDLQVSQMAFVINYSSGESVTQNYIYQYDSSKLLSKITLDETETQTIFRETKDGYQSITYDSVYNENSDSGDFEVLYTCDFDKNGNRLNVIFKEDGKTSIMTEYTYNSKNQRITQKKFFNERYTSMRTFEYNTDDLLIREIIKTFPYEKNKEEKVSPSKEPEIRVYEYEFY